MSALAGDGSAGYGAVASLVPLTEGSAPSRLRYKWRNLWGGLRPAALAKIQMDEVATFSVTQMRVADEMSAALRGLPGITERSSIVDATACVGGNTVSFARFFGDVVSLELDKSRAKMLRSNVELCRSELSETSTPFLGRVEVRCGDCTEVCAQLPRQAAASHPPQPSPPQPVES